MISQVAFQWALTNQLGACIDAHRAQLRHRLNQRLRLFAFGQGAQEHEPQRTARRRSGAKLFQRLLIDVAARMPDRRFAVAGAQYPAGIAWPANVERIDHLPPALHAEFYSASGYALNVTRADMIRAGWSPSVRLFEAAACGTPIISDIWPGLDELLAPGEEIILAADTEDVVAAIIDGDGEAMGRKARSRVLALHTASARAAELEAHIREATPVRANASLAEAG